MKKTSPIIPLLITVLSLLVVIAPATADGNGNGQSKMSPRAQAVAQQGGQERVDVIVQYASPPGQADNAHAEAHGAQLKRDYEHFRMKALSVPETAPRGRYLAGPVDWEKPDLERAEALGLEMEIVNAGQASALWAELDAAYKRGEPIMLFNWTPNWVEAKYEGKFVDFPDHDTKCESDASWGMNPDLPYDCGNPKAGWLKKGVWAGQRSTHHLVLAMVSGSGIACRETA